MLYKLPGTFFIPVYLDLVRPLFSDHCFLFNSVFIVKKKKKSQTFSVICKMCIYCTLMFCISSSFASPPVPGLTGSLWTQWEVMAAFAVPPTTWTSW